MVMQYLHEAVHGAGRVCFLIKVFCEAGCVAVASECFFVFFEPCGEASPGLSDMCLITCKNNNNQLLALVSICYRDKI